MKKLLFGLSLIFALASCDTVSEKDRYVEADDIEVARKVLLEEFTGQRCTNCPAAHAVIEKLQEQYGDDLIVVSIHAGNFGIPAEDGGLMQEEGDEYAAHWGISVYPCGVVDRNSGVLNSDAWAASIRDDMGKETSLDLGIEANVSGDRKEITVDAKMATSSKVEGNLQLWVVENDIIGFQIDGNNRLNDYVHNNVFRSCVNGLWGESVTLLPNENYDESYTIAVDEEWDVDNLFIVGFIYNNSGVLQVERVAVK